MKDVRTLSAAFFFPAALTLAGTAAAAAPLIESVTANAALTAVTINGTNFAGTNRVLLSGYATPLVVTSVTSSRIVASLPSGLAPGSYAIRVETAGNGNGNGNGNQGNGNGGNNFDEFFATFTAAAAGSGGNCTSYSNSMTSATFAASLSVNQPGNYALSAKLVANTFGGLATVHCNLTQVAPVVLVDDTYATGQGETLVMLQGTVTTTAPAQFQVTCTTTAPITLSFYNSKIQAICLPALVSPSP
jgi:hypothetical protein